MKTTTCIALLSLACTLSAQAQQQRNDSTLNRTIVIENQYNPQVMDANRINVLPSIEEPKASKSSIEYATGQRLFDAFTYEAMSMFGRQPKQANAPHSYINLGYGNNGNLTAELNHLFRLSDADRLNIYAAFDGKNYEADDDGAWSGWCSRFYRSQLKAGYSHLFTNNLLGATLDFSTQTFNYLPITADDGTALTDKQNNLIGGINLYFRSRKPELAWQYHVEAGMRYFGRDYLPGEATSNSETNLRLNAGLSYGWNEQSRAGLDLRVNHATFSTDLEIGSDVSLENNGVIGFTPYYAFQSDYMHLRAGVNIDLNTGVESGVNISPDVRAEFPINRQYTLYAQAKGGTELNDYFRFNTVSPYWTFYLPGAQLENTHIQLDALAGFRAALVDNLWLDFYVGYELRKNEISCTSLSDESIVLPSLTQGKANNFKLGLAASYQYKDLIEVCFDGSYHSWSTDDNKDYLLFDKPQLDLKVDLGVHPTPALTFNLGYQHRTYAKGEMEAVANLYAGVDYKFFKYLSAWVKAANLMNKEYTYYYGYPEEGINFMVGASFRF